MIRITIFKICSIGACSFHTTISQKATAGRFMRKVMGSSSKKKRVFIDDVILPTPNTFSKGAFEGKYSGSAKRASVLNKLFMRHITDLMATGDYATEFLGHGIEISKVQVTPNYKGLNVFWVAKGTVDDEIVEKMLKKNAGFLRHELSTMRVMGVVPMIQFVKDKQYSQITELDNRLAKADFGEDYTPIETATKLKTQLELYTPLPPDIRERIQKFDNEFVDSGMGEEEATEAPLPPMPQDVLGLNHSDILNKILKNMKKSAATHRFSNNVENENVQQTNENPIQFSSSKEQREAFKQFLEKRELLRNRIKRGDRNYQPDMEYIKEEMKERHENYFKNMDIFEDENDYIIDEEDVRENKQ